LCDVLIGAGKGEISVEIDIKDNGDNVKIRKFDTGKEIIRNRKLILECENEIE